MSYAVSTSTLKMRNERGIVVTDQIKLTKTRADVLRAVAANKVTRRRNWDIKRPDTDRQRSDDGSSDKNVTTAVAFLHKADLVKLGFTQGNSVYSPSLWQVTELGQQWLDQA